MQKFELAHEPTEGPVYGAGGVKVSKKSGSAITSRNVISLTVRVTPNQ